MTNFEKYKTPEEAHKAYYLFCYGNRWCSKCKYYLQGNKELPCYFEWLYDGADKENNKKDSNEKRRKVQNRAGDCE